MEILSRNEMRRVKAGQVEPDSCTNCQSDEFCCTCGGGPGQCYPGTTDGVCNCASDCGVTPPVPCKN